MVEMQDAAAFTLYARQQRLHGGFAQIGIREMGHAALCAGGPTLECSKVGERSASCGRLGKPVVPDTGGDHIKARRKASGPVRSVWWSWGESNPRPKALAGQIYTFS